MSLRPVVPSSQPLPLTPPSPSLSESGTRFRLVEMEGQEAIAQETTLAALDALLLDSDRLLFAATGKLFSPHRRFRSAAPERNQAMKLLKYVATCFHCVLDYQQDGRKDDLDELMLKGMKRSGHIDWSGARYIPEGLQHRSSIHKTLWFLTAELNFQSKVALVCGEKIISLHLL
ncbi:hypothetical protein BCR33DRAFT_799173 [Rhizoclosmatium globosum]|uniref:Uncharacterized protein n=1 Tax=Rhizoclosmatium globosum TaxID=329046 RepID=A0A1Y2ABQ6_9FUNG|nr:hypothetical protein BCR33DRAFT_799173 [Rhizoclosmatium globosum]|eukprot:ORY19979.1 hypothetical protein BCR33DRAFT_799173 [Rhizoclosmatium globosum]